MKKFLFFIVTFITMLGGVYAQKVNWGAKAELNLSNFVGSDAGGSNCKVGYAIGILGDFPFSQALSLAPELKYANIGAKGDVEGTEATMNFNYIALPIMLRCHFNPTVALEIGPQFAYLVSVKTEISKVTVDMTDQFEKFDASLGAGLLLEFDKMFFTGRYNYSITKFYKNQNAFHAVAAIGFGIKF